MTGYEFHPEAETDLDEIWEYITADNARAADRVIADIRRALGNLVPIPHRGQTHRSDQPSRHGRNSQGERVSPRRPYPA